MLQTRYVFGPRLLETQDHVHTIQHNVGPNSPLHRNHSDSFWNQLTRHLSGLFPEVFEEIQMALNEQKLPENGAYAIVLYPQFITIVCD